MSLTNDQLEEVTRLYTKVAEQTTEIAQLKAYAQETALALHRQGAEIERLQKREAQFAAALYAVNPKRYSVVLDPEGGDPMEFDIEGSWVRFDEIEHLQKCLSEALELCRQTTFDDGAISKWEWDQRYLALKAHTAEPDAHQQWKCANSHVRGDDPNCPVCFPFEPLPSSHRWSEPHPDACAECGKAENDPIHDMRSIPKSSPVACPHCGVQQEIDGAWHKPGCPTLKSGEGQ